MYGSNKLERLTTLRQEGFPVTNTNLLVSFVSYEWAQYALAFISGNLSSLV